MKKIILTVFAATSLLLYSTPSFAIVSVSVGMPMTHTITGKYTGLTYGNAVDKTSGYFLGVSFNSIGLGIDSYTTKFKTDDSDGSWGPQFDAGLKTNMTNIFYQLPVPVVNLIIGLGMGTTAYDCSVPECDAVYDKGSATQWYTSIGLPLIPLFDIHLSYRSITAKNIMLKSDKSKDDNSGTVTGLGLAFNF
jgi:hypothetical protein